MAHSTQEVKKKVPFGLSTILEEEIIVPAIGVNAFCCRVQFIKFDD